MPQTQNSLSVDVKALRRVVRYQFRFAFGIAHCPKKNVVVQMECFWVLIGSTMISKRTAACSLQPILPTPSDQAAFGIMQEPQVRAGIYGATTRDRLDHDMT